MSTYKHNYTICNDMSTISDSYCHTQPKPQCINVTSILKSTNSIFSFRTSFQMNISIGKLVVYLPEFVKFNKASLIVGFVSYVCGGVIIVSPEKIIDCNAFMIQMGCRNSGKIYIDVEFVI